MSINNTDFINKRTIFNLLSKNCCDIIKVLYNISLFHKEMRRAVVPVITLLVCPAIKLQLIHCVTKPLQKHNFQFSSMHREAPVYKE